MFFNENIMSSTLFRTIYLYRSFPYGPEAMLSVPLLCSEKRKGRFSAALSRVKDPATYSAAGGNSLIGACESERFCCRIRLSRCWATLLI